jgi:pullulanase/glycogen debranching enzyme
VELLLFDREDDARSARVMRLQRPSSRTIVYEMHVRGFTRHRSSGAAAPLKA